MYAAVRSDEANAVDGLFGQTDLSFKRHHYEPSTELSLKIAINALFLVKGKGGGLETYLNGVVRALGKLDSSNEYVLYTNIACAGAIEIEKNFREVVLNVSAEERVKKNLYEQTAFPSVIKRAGIDLLFNPGNVAPALHHCPSIAVMHDMVPYERPENFTPLELNTLKAFFSMTARTSTLIVTVSEYSKRAMIERFNLPISRVRVIYNGVDAVGNVDKAEARTSVTDESGSRTELERGYILSVASSRKYKNIDALLRAFKILREEKKITQKLVLAGRAERVHSELIELARALGVSNDVIFIGHVDKPALSKLYAGAGVLAYPSFFEGFGLPVLEAFAHSTPVCASNAASIPEVVGDAGLLFDPSDDRAIADAIHRILNDTALNEALVKKGLDRAKLFTWERNAGELLKIFSEVAGR
jgi:glycosyltransferase involved in cell wall biosynthesis